MTVKTICADGVVPTLCRMCDTRCGINVHLKNRRLIDITPFQGNPVNYGRMCPRGAAALDVFHHPDRIKKPLKRLPGGGHAEISWEQAMDEIAERLALIKDEHGVRSVGVWKGEGVGFFQQEEYARRFIHAFGSPNYFSNDSICFNGRAFGHRLVTGFYNAFPEFTEARLILFFGTNPPMCHPPFMAELADARQNGAKIVVVDPRLNPIACYADIFAQPYPGTDGALGWGLIRYLIEKKAYDPEFVSKYTVGFEKIAAYAARFTPEYVEELSGIWADVLVRIGEYLIQYKPKVSIYPGTGLEHHDNGVNNMRTFAILACLAGALDLPSGLIWAESPGVRDLTLYNEIELPPEHREPIGAGRFPVLFDLAREGHTLKAMDYMLGRGQYPFKGLIVLAANPAVTNPNTSKVEQALASLDLLVVNDFFLTPTARLAHYVLPGATYLETSDLHYYRKRQMMALSTKIAEVEGIRTGYHMWRDLALRLGFGEKYFPWPDEDAVNRYVLEPTGITLEDLKSHPEGIVYKPIAHRKYLTRPLPTPSGKVEFASEYLKSKGLAEIPEYTPPFYRRHPSAEFPLVLTTGARKSLFYGSCHQNIARFRMIHPAPEVEIHPEDASKLGIKTGDKVRIVSEMGSVEAPARVVGPSEFLPGVVEMYHGWQDWRVNLVTCDNHNDPISGFPILKSVPVRVEKVG